MPADIAEMPASSRQGTEWQVSCGGAATTTDEEAAR